MHTGNKKKKKIQSICSHSAVFLFSSLLCSAIKNENMRKKQQKKNNK